MTDLSQGLAILDFGSQFTQLIARRLRELGVYCEIYPFNIELQFLKDKKPKGIILSGGPSSVNDLHAPLRNVTELAELAPILGICYGMQLVAREFGGVIRRSDKREYGLNQVEWSETLSGVPKNQKVWMSHGDAVEVPPPGFQVIARSDNGHAAAIRSDRVLALQFHPEVAHTDFGDKILEAYARETCRLPMNWRAPQILDRIQQDLKKLVPPNEDIICALSGGVDSTVVASLLTKVFGPERVHCVFVNNGLLRKNEFQQVLATYQELKLNVHGVDAEDRFLSELANVDDPEQKRKIIGRVFIEVFEQEKNKLKNIQWLAQGTLYPDVIESVSPRGESVTIKSHHNVGGLPAKLNLKLVEPLRELFKDEVRAIGQELGLPRAVLGRHPFPGPGLAIRVMGAVTREDLDIVRNADAIYIEELKRHNLYDQIWQAFCVLLPIRTVGVQGDSRTYDKVLALRAVTSRDGMTADWFSFPAESLAKISNRITNEVNGVNRVVYDVTSKPPGTIEWE